jgi:hypothetical protein
MAQDADFEAGGPVNQQGVSGKGWCRLGAFGGGTQGSVFCNVCVVPYNSASIESLLIKVRNAKVFVTTQGRHSNSHVY